MHSVLKLWVRPVKSGPMEERDSLATETGAGVVGDHTFGKRRHITLLFADDWAEAVRDLGRPVDPSARRANVLLTGGNGATLLGSVMRLGEVEIEVKGITTACSNMDRAADGLQEALKPDRAGVWGLIRSGGTIRTGDRLGPR